MLLMNVTDLFNPKEKCYVIFFYIINYSDHTKNLPSSLWLEFGRRLDSQPMMLVDHGQNYHSL